MFSCIHSWIFDAYLTYFLEYYSAYLSNLLHMCAILFWFLASSDLIALLIHARPCSSCFLVPVLLSVCSWLLFLVPVSAAAGQRVHSISNSRPPCCAAAPSLKPKLQPRRQSRSRPARFSFARSCCSSNRKQCAGPFDTHFCDAAGELEGSKTMSLSNLW
jgi:hypothetical protein